MGDFGSHLAAVFIEGGIAEFERTGSPISAIESLIMCDAAGVYPPVSILKWLANALHEFNKSDGKADLKKLLSIAGSRGRENAYGKERRINESNRRARQLHCLVCVFGISIDKAANMVWARETEECRSPPEASWIEEEYRKKWKEELKTEYEKYFSEYPPSENKERWNEFLHSFPDYSRLG